MTRYFNEDYIYEIIDSPSLYQEIQRIREAMGFSRTFHCTQCSYRASIEIGAPSASPALSILKYTKHDPDSRDLYFRCPLCNATLSVGPVKVLNTKTKGYNPRSFNVSVMNVKKEISLLPLWTALSVVFFFGFIFFIVNQFFMKG
jgi:hypothetical protein